MWLEDQFPNAAAGLALVCDLEDIRLYKKQMPLLSGKQLTVHWVTKSVMLPCV